MAQWITAKPVAGRPRWSSRATFGARLTLGLGVALCAAGALGQTAAVPTAATAASTTVAHAEPVAAVAALEASVAQLVDTVTPSVVSIRVERTTADPNSGTTTHLIVNGSGVVLQADGLILTNEHVVQSASSIEVVLSNGTRCAATRVGADRRSDLAVLHIARTDLTAARFCDWAGVHRGQWVVALGNPYGIGGDGQACVSVGTLANLGRHLPGLGAADDRLYTNMIQTTAAIHPGNSGGPLFNLRGEVVGIVTAVYTRTVDDAGLGFAIALTPDKTALIERLARGEQIDYGYLGLAVRDTTDMQSADQHGALVTAIEPNGPAAAAGVQAADLITMFGRAPIASASDLAERIGATPAGQQVALTLWRAGETRTCIITTIRRDAPRAGALANRATRGGTLLTHP